MNKAASGGFSLLELMIVIVILALLATALVPNLMDRPDEARVTKAKMDIRQIEFALKLYKLDNGNFPTTDQGLKALIMKPDTKPEPRNYRSGGYLESSDTPKDPWGNEFIYRAPGDSGRNYDIISLGSDGEEGGEGFAQDINSWEIS